MDRELIERLAAEAGIEVYADHLTSYESETVRVSTAERFAALIAEECAKVSESLADKYDELSPKWCADAIRAKFSV